jgi:ribosomal RNA small subunit methyltransferase RsmB
MSSLSSRAIAATLLTAVLQDKRSLREVIPTLKPDPFAKMLCYGVLRHYLQLTDLLKALTPHPIKIIEVKALLLIGLYQLFFLDTKAHAAVMETVNATKELKQPWATALINGVLRNALRQHAQLALQNDENLATHENHPHWLYKKIQRAYPHDWQTLLQANNQHPPLTLRVNRCKISRPDYLTLLEAAGMAAKITGVSQDGVILTCPVPVEKIPGFAQGLVSVQDEGAQLAASLLDAKPHQTLLDACAAPGGKTTHLLEHITPLAHLIAIDNDAKRLALVHTNLTRLCLWHRADKIDLFHEGIEDFAKKWQTAYFDRILLDAPCSATGVIRRHPDIKWLRRSDDIPALVQTQAALLEAVWSLLKPGGVLLYVTCSILPEENALLVGQFLQTRQDAKEIILSVDWGKAMPVGRQMLPGEGDRDGFYFAKLQKMI